MKSDAARQAGRQIKSFNFFCRNLKRFLLELVLQQEEVVGGGDRDDVLCRVPGSVEDLLVEVKTVDIDLVLLALTAGAYLKVGILEI